jgi:hypothetical protein
MKILLKPLSVLFLTVMTVSVQAQENKNKAKELGFFVETAMDNSAVSNGLYGVQFKKETKPNKAIRVQLMYQKKNFQAEPYDYSFVKDTMKTTQTIQKSTGFYGGFGIEQQRQFYKKIFLYASLDARVGYSKSAFYKNIKSSAVDTVNGVYSTNPYSNYSIPEKISDWKANRFSFDILPSIGSKLIFQKLVLGIETGLNISNSYLSQSGTGLKKYSIYDLNISYMQFRAYINYRFL